MILTLLWCCSFCPGAPSRSSGPPPSAYNFLVLCTDQISQDREKFCSERKSDAPSNGGKPQNFLPGQSEPDQRIPCNRPYGCPTALPLSLLHPIFGEFVDDAENYVPTPDDVPSFLAFVVAMANIYMEDGRRDAVLTLLPDDNGPLLASKSVRHFNDKILEPSVNEVVKTIPVSIQLECYNH